MRIYNKTLGYYLNSCGFAPTIYFQFYNLVIQMQLNNLNISYICKKLTFMKDKIYIDTSVLGGYYDIEFEKDTKIFFNRVLNKEFSVYISEITDTELLFAPERVKSLLNEIPADCLTNLSISKEVDDLANTYISEKALGKASLNDAYHIAIATVNKINVLVSWNFKHIVNLNKIRLFNSVNVKLGYSLIEIRCPKELISDE